MKEDLRKDLALLFEKHYREYCLLSYSYVSCPDLAQDIVQDVFFDLLTNTEGTPILNLKGYIWRSVKYSSLKQAERSKKLTSLTENSQIPVFHLDDENQVPDLGPKLQGAIEKLPEQCRKVFELCALDGHKYQNAADFLGISVNTVKTQMKKAYKMLRYNLKDLYLILLLLIVY